MGLLGMGAPPDEYDPEVADLAEEQSPMSPHRVRSVFEHWFGDSVDISAEATERIADGVNRVRIEGQHDR